MKPKKLKPQKAWAVVDKYNNYIGVVPSGISKKLQLEMCIKDSGSYAIFTDKKFAKEYLFNQYKVIPVLISPIKKKRI